ncbi:MAG TPA: hypothetical protein VN132_14255 [Bdellovibrio sp.]|nr:hypothetical protein [Bdellovibrio sp.]
MSLADFFFKNDEQKKLAQLVWAESLEASVREFSLMSGLNYATTYELLHRMEELGLVKRTVKGRSTLYSSTLSKDEKALFMKLAPTVSSQQQKKIKFGDTLLKLGLPYRGKSEDLGSEYVADNEELVVHAVWRAKKNSTLARALPVMLAQQLTTLNPHRLMYWAKQYKVKREFGFFIDLTGLLSGNRNLRKLARDFHDQRWSQDEFLFSNEENLTGFQSQLVEQNTPDLARWWHLKMNMGMDSFESLFQKFSKGLR